ncbi:hypothetical protein HHK36_027149 [Tetracentron sinense]|uniref:Glycosyltransferase n=1 Tax=Tetracentron sinense TaxID=13715 RepID=A0A834YM55_TETSI|nr:hypothetical protein HHK36_027149 [Tetracentron sinense]
MQASISLPSLHLLSSSFLHIAIDPLQSENIFWTADTIKAADQSSALVGDNQEIEEEPANCKTLAHIKAGLNQALQGSSSISWLSPTKAELCSAALMVKLQIPSALLWIQPATLLAFYYYYFNGYRDVITSNSNDPSYCVELPGLPLLSSRDLPSFFLPSNTYGTLLPTLQEQFQKLEGEAKPILLVNTFDALEVHSMRAVDRFNLIGIGPLIPSAFLDGKDPSDKSFGGDLFHGSEEYYMEWLNSKPESSVIYVSFGSMIVLSKPQMEEIGKGLLESRRPFLWVIRQPKNETEEDGKTELNNIEELRREGMIVPWCSQVEVLSHPSVGCFVTHCGWNSTLESLVTGVPVVAFPQWTDQWTNAKLLEDVWKTGVRVRMNEGEEIVGSDEIKRCLETVMGGERGKEMKRNAMKWKDLAMEAVKEGGSSDRNLREFVDEVGNGRW